MNPQPARDHVPPVLSRRTVLGSALLGTLVTLPPATATADVPGPPARSWRPPRRGRDLFVDPVHGDDRWRGNLPEPVGGNGPLATLDQATARAYEQSAALADERGRDPLHIWLRGGTHRRTEPWRIGPHETSARFRFLAYPGEEPVISGSQEITGWQPIRRNGRELWKTTVPEVRDGGQPFTQLFVNGRSRPRPRLPKTINAVLEHGRHIPPDDADFFFHFQSGTASEPGVRTFVYRPGDIDPNWYDLTAIDVIAMDNWYDERAPIESVDAPLNECTVAFRPYHTKDWGLRYYYVENVFEALTEPGEWYLDRRSGEVYYLPMPGEAIGTSTISAPRVRQLLTLAGTPERPVEHLTFAGITFEHTAWDYWRQPEWQDGQSAANTIGAIELREARDCTFTDCRVRRVGEYGIALEEGCQRVSITHSEIAEPGSGGIKIASNRGYPGIDRARTGDNVITDNHIHHTGRVFHLGAGILARDTFGNLLAHNHIHDLYYTGISVGWNWGFGDHPARDNRVEFNHIHHLSVGPLLSDLGGIYTLGVQPGTEVRNNYIHHIEAHHYGAHGLYPDQASSFIRWENNLVHDAQDGLFLHFGADNIVRNNIFARTRTTVVQLYNRDRGSLSDLSLRVTNNVLVSHDCPIFSGGPEFALKEQGSVISDNNLLWNSDGAVDDDGTLDVRQIIKIVSASDGRDVPASMTDVVFEGTERGTFVFGRLAEPVRLEADTRYHLVTQSDVGGPQWYNPSELDVTGVATVVGSTYYWAGAYHPSTDARCFGPLNFKYLSAAGVETTFVTGFEAAPELRNDHPGFVGMTIEIGSEPITLTALGRLVPTDSWWELWKGGGRDQHSIVDDPLFVDADRDDFALAPRSPALTSPVLFVPIDLSTIGPRPSAR